MTLSAGQKLGHYEILASLGAGGMGEVYRATDTKLGRTVALKLLLQEVAADPDRLQRFEREARVLASLNHNNIATLHGFEADGDTNFLVMELVPGETLADRISRGPIPVAEATDLFLQIAVGLETAHAQGVIHRDLKPANIKVSPDGDVKILDFGLAKALVEPTVEHDQRQSDSPTMTLAATRRGEILGTAAYMSPEQAKGQTVDERADIWSFGVCLWEALTGGRLFVGDSAAETMAAVLRSDPEWEELPFALPQPTVRLLRRCLKRDPRERLRAIGDAALELRDARAAVDSPLDLEAPNTTPTPSVGLWKRAVPWALAVVSTLLAVWAMSGRTEEDRHPEAAARFEIDLPAGTDFADATPNHLLAFAPDGSSVVWSGKQAESTALYRRPIDSLDVEILRGSEGGSLPFFSPDGEWLAFYAENELRKIPPAGGAAVKIASARAASGGVWSEDDKIYISRIGRLSRLPAGGGEAETVVEELAQFAPRWVDHRASPVPGDRWLLLSLLAGEGRHLIVAYDLEKREARSLGEGVGPRLLDTGHLLFARRNALLAVPFDVQAIEFRGEPRVVLEGIDVDWMSYPLFDVAEQGGALAYVPEGAAAGGTLVLADRSGSVLAELLEVPGFSLGSRFSPTTDRVSISLPGSTAGQLELWTVGVDRSAKIPLTFGVDRSSWTGVFSPDGRQIAFVSAVEIGYDVVVAAADGTGEIRSVVSSEVLPPHNDLQLADWSKDGRFLSLSLQPPGGGWDVWTYDLQDEVLTEFLATPFLDQSARFSPDRRFVAYESDRSGTRQIFVRSFPDGDEEVQISTGGGRNAHWSGDGRTLHFMAGSSVMRIDVLDESGALAPGAPEVLFDGPFRSALDFDVSDDGERFLLVRYQEGQGPRIHVVENWLEELERLVPTR